MRGHSYPARDGRRAGMLRLRCDLRYALVASPLSMTDSACELLGKRRACRAKQAGIAAEDCLGDDRFLAGVVCDLWRRRFICATNIIGDGSRIDERAVAEYGEHRGSEGVPGTKHAATNDEHFEIQDVDEACQEDAEHFSETVEYALGIGIALMGEQVDGFRAEFGIGAESLGEPGGFTRFGGFAGHPDDSCSRCVTFRASVISAAAG